MIRTELQKHRKEVQEELTTKNLRFKLNDEVYFYDGYPNNIAFYKARIYSVKIEGNQIYYRMFYHGLEEDIRYSRTERYSIPSSNISYNFNIIRELAYDEVIKQLEIQESKLNTLS